ncbi:outer membrane beta-barrel protein [Candidatus Neomarinimicrobiota bacterium]
MRQVMQISILSISLIFGSLNAQNEKEISPDNDFGKFFSQFFVGASVNFSSTTNHIKDNDDSKTGISVGVGAYMNNNKLPIIKNSNILSSLRYSIAMRFEQAGSTWNNAKAWNNSDGKISLYYLSLPLMLEFPLCQAYLIAGLKPRILMGGSESWSYKSDSGDMEYTEDVKDSGANLMDYSIVIGTGMPFSVRNQNFNFTAMYEHGLRPVWDRSDNSIKNKSVNLSIDWKF